MVPCLSSSILMIRHCLPSTALHRISTAVISPSRRSTSPRRGLSPGVNDLAACKTLGIPDNKHILAAAERACYYCIVRTAFLHITVPCVGSCTTAVASKLCSQTYNKDCLLAGCFESQRYHAHCCCLRAAARDTCIRATDAIAARPDGVDGTARRKPHSQVWWQRRARTAWHPEHT